MASKKSKVPAVVVEAQAHAEHLDKDLMDRIVATPWFFAGTTFDVTPSGVIKVVYFHNRSDTDHWYRGRLMWREEGKWKVDGLGYVRSLAKGRAAVDALFESEAA